MALGFRKRPALVSVGSPGVQIPGSGKRPFTKDFSAVRRKRTGVLGSGLSGEGFTAGQAVVRPASGATHSAIRVEIQTRLTPMVAVGTLTLTRLGGSHHDGLCLFKAKITE
jgi:hypothetical protein